MNATIRKSRNSPLPAFSALTLVAIGVACWLGSAAFADEPAPARLSPSGFRGTLIASLANSPDKETISRVLRDVPQPDGKVVVVLLDVADGEVTSKALAEAGKKKIETVRVSNKAAANDNEALKHCAAANAVFMISTASEKEISEQLRDSALLQQMRLLLDRRGVLALCGTSSLLAGEQYLDRESNKPLAGLRLLPDTCLAALADNQNAEAMAKGFAEVPNLIGCALSDSAALCVSGRDLGTLNDLITLRLAANKSRAVREQDLSVQRPVDYNEWVRAARGRVGDVYPPAEVATPEVPDGALVIIGGGGMPAEIGRKFVELGGGAEGHFVVLPTAQPDPLPLTGEGNFLKRFGAQHITVISAREQADLETPENLKTLTEATGIWFGGGRQWRFMDAYEGTKLHAMFWDVLKRGGVIGGSSAGATIQGDYLVRGAPAGPHIMMCEGYERGLGFLPGTAIDQHFTQRKRHPDMTAMMKVYPQYLGIGLDEATAIVVRGHVAEVMGPGAAHFYDRRKELVADQPDYEAFRKGEMYDLKERRVILREPSPPENETPATP